MANKIVIFCSASREARHTIEQKITILFGIFNQQSFEGLLICIEDKVKMLLK